MPNDTPVRPNRIERALGVMAATVLGVAIVDIVVILILALTKVSLSSGVGQFARWLPLPALAIGLVLLIAFIFVSGLRRRRESQQDARR